MDSFKKFYKDKLPDTCEFYSFLKDGWLAKKIIYMLLMFGICLKWLQWMIIMIFI